MVTAPEAVSVRQANGRFAPGYSGNPAGPKPQPGLDMVLRRRIAGEDGAAILDELIAMCLRQGRDQRQAIEYVFNRCYGSPRQTVAIERSDDDPGVLLMRQLWQAFSNGAVGLSESAQPPAWIDAEYAASSLPEASSAPSQPST